MSTATIPDAVEAPAVLETAVVPLASIRLGANVRRDFGDVEGLAKTIRKTGGLLQNLVVWRTDDGGYELLLGGRRYQAAQLAACETVPVTIRPQPSEQERLEFQVIENNERLDLSMPEVLEAVQDLLDLGVTDADLAATVGGSSDEAATLRSIVALGPAVHELIASGHLTIPDAAPLAELTDLGESYIEYAVSCIHQGSKPAAAARQAKDKHHRDQVVAEATALATSRKLRLIEAPDYGDFGYGSPTKRLGKGHGCLDVPVKQHAKLPCHAAYIDRHAGTAKAAIVLVCTDAKSHRPAPTPIIGGAASNSGELTSGQKAANTRRHRKEWSATHVSRNVAVTALIQALPLDEAMARVAWHVLQECGANRDAYLMAARLLGITDLDPEAHVAKAVDDYAHESGENAVRAAVAVLTARAERGFQQKEGLGYGNGVIHERLNVRDHFQLLQRHGQGLKEAEINHLRDYCSLPGFTATGDGSLMTALEDADALEEDVDATDGGGDSEFVDAVTDAA